MKLASVAVLLATEATALELRHRANPIRKVVSMLQLMQQKVEDEGAKEKELHEKFICYCNNGAGGLEESIEGYKQRIPTLEAAIEAATSKTTQLKTEVAGHQQDRAEAKKTLGEATGVREREAADFKSFKEETQTEISQITRATAALQKGLGGFLQTGTAAYLKKLVLAKEDLEEGDRDTLLSFLSQEDGASAPGTDEIVGILKQMNDESAKELADRTAAEQKSIKTYDGLVRAKNKEIASTTGLIEVKLVRTGDLEVELATSKNDLDDVEAALEDDQRFLIDLKKDCSKAGEKYAENEKLRKEELLALADTIKLLNDDDALELFKKTLPNPGASFLQLAVTTKEMRSRALQLLHASRKHAANAVPIDFIAVALQGQKVGFDKIIKMVDGLVAELKKEQADDDAKKDYCGSELDKKDDEKKVLQKEIKDLNTNIDDANEAIAKLGDEVASLEAGIKALDTQVAEATAQRKEESAEFTNRMAADNAAKQLLEYAKNRLNKFYNPKLYKAPAKTEEALLQRGQAKAESLAKYQKQTEESSGVIQMINHLILDLEKDMKEAEVIEQDAQADYEQMLRDASEKRVVDSKALEEKSDARTQTIASVQDYKGAKHIASKTLEAVEQAIMNLHSECDFLLKYFDVRKEARSNEIDSLTKAKAVLNGADFE